MATEEQIERFCESIFSSADVKRDRMAEQFCPMSTLTVRTFEDATTAVGISQISETLEKSRPKWERGEEVKVGGVTGVISLPKRGVTGKITRCDDNRIIEDREIDRESEAVMNRREFFNHVCKFRERESLNE